MACEIFTSLAMHLPLANTNTASGALFCHPSARNVNGSCVAVNLSILCHVSSSTWWLILLQVVWVHVPVQVVYDGKILAVFLLLIAG